MEMGSMIDQAETEQDVEVQHDNGVPAHQINLGSAAATSAGGGASLSVDNRNIQPSNSVGQRINQEGHGSSRLPRATG